MFGFLLILMGLLVTNNLFSSMAFWNEVGDVEFVISDLEILLASSTNLWLWFTVCCVWLLGY